MSGRFCLTTLGGGQSVGASCYLLEFGTHAVLLDCGRGKQNRTLFGPDFTRVAARRPLRDIEAVFISHAHIDHIGFLPELSKLCGRIPAYASRLTTELGQVLLWDNFDSTWMTEAQRFRYAQDFADAFAAVNPAAYSGPMDFGDYRVTFYEAGHIPGAAAIYLESEAGSVLYTGDFSTENTVLSGGLALPEGLKADTVILDGTYAKRPGTRGCRLYDADLDWLSRVRYRPLNIRVRQLTKGIELLGLILEKMKSGRIPAAKIHLSEEIWNVAMAFQRVGIQVMNENCYPLTAEAMNRGENALFLSEKPLYCGMEEHTVDYSLHSGFPELKRFAEERARKNVAVVHSPNADRRDFYALEDACRRDLNFLYPDSGDTFEL